jgi:hypothetical protein
LSCYCVKLVGKRHAFALQHELAFANHVHQFNAGRDRARRSKRFEAEHRPCEAFDRAVILFDNVVEVFDLRIVIGTSRSLFSDRSGAMATGACMYCCAGKDGASIASAGTGCTVLPD